MCNPSRREAHMAEAILSDELWQVIEPLLPRPKRRRFRSPGRKPIGHRQTLTGIPGTDSHWRARRKPGALRRRILYISGPNDNDRCRSAYVGCRDSPFRLEGFSERTHAVTAEEAISIARK